MDSIKKVIFAGTPDFAVAPLKSLLQSDYEVVAVYTQPDRPAGRGRKLAFSPVKEAAVAAGIRVEQPQNFKETADIEILQSLGADLMIVVAYGLLLPLVVLETPKYGCINIHASLLPRWRGAAPIQRAIAAGDAETGISIMQMDVGLDTGAVYSTRRIAIDSDDTGGSLHDRLSVAGAELLMETLPAIFNASIEPVAQQNDLASYASKLVKKEAEIDWQQPAAQIAAQVRAFNPWPVAFTRFESANLRIWNAQPIKGVAGEPGMVMAAGRAGIDVATGEGLLRISSLQMPGKRAMAAQDFINSQEIQGMMLG